MKSGSSLEFINLSLKFKFKVSHLPKQVEGKLEFKEKMIYSIQKLAKNSLSKVQTSKVLADKLEKDVLPLTICRNSLEFIDLSLNCKFKVSHLPQQLEGKLEFGGKNDILRPENSKTKLIQGLDFKSLSR